MKSLRVAFKNFNGSKLGARIDMPEELKPEHYALFAHCFTCTKNIKSIGNINKALTEHRIAVLRFDFTGLGESDGDFTETNFTTNVQDLIAAAEFLRNEYESPKILIGHSLGGAAVLQAASSIPSSVAVVTIAAPCEPSHLNRLLKSEFENIKKKGEGYVTIAGKSFKIKRQFIEDLERTRMQEKIHNLNRALIIFHSPRDTVVGIKNAAHIFQAAHHPKSFISLDDADHLLLNENDSIYVGDLIGVWVKKYLNR